MIDTLITRYHRDKGFPTDHPMPAPGTWLRYSPHALDKATQRLTRASGAVRAALVQLLPERLPSRFEVIEVTTFAGRPAHWLVRFPLMEYRSSKLETGEYVSGVVRTDYDVVMALGTGLGDPMTVRTVYLNHKDDQHATLRTERYQEGK